jgi:hypothetical protein
MRVLLATDGTNHARMALRWLRHLPLPGGAEVFALSVAPLQRPPEGLQSVEDLRDSLLADAASIAEQARKALADRWPDARAQVAEGIRERKSFVSPTRAGSTLSSLAREDLDASRGCSSAASRSRWRATHNRPCSLPEDPRERSGACSSRWMGLRTPGERSSSLPASSRPPGSGREAARRRSDRAQRLPRGGTIAPDRRSAGGDLARCRRMDCGSPRGRVARTRSDQTSAAWHRVGGRAPPRVLSDARGSNPSTMGCDSLPLTATTTTRCRRRHGRSEWDSCLRATHGLSTATGPPVAVPFQGRSHPCALT